MHSVRELVICLYMCLSFVELLDQFSLNLMLEVHTKSYSIGTVLVKTGWVAVYICIKVNVCLHQDQPMTNGFEGEPSSEEFCNTDSFCMELSLSRTIVTELVNVALTPGLVFRRCL